MTQPQTQRALPPERTALENDLRRRVIAMVGVRTSWDPKRSVYWTNDRVLSPAEVSSLVDQVVRGALQLLSALDHPSPHDCQQASEAAWNGSRGREEKGLA